MRTSHAFQDPQNIVIIGPFKNMENWTIFPFYMKNLCKNSFNFRFWKDSPCLISSFRELLGNYWITSVFQLHTHFPQISGSSVNQSLCFSQYKHLSFSETHRFFLFVYFLLFAWEYFRISFLLFIKVLVPWTALEFTSYHITFYLHI